MKSIGIKHFIENEQIFTENQVPDKTSDLTNDSGFISQIPVASENTLGGIKVGNNLSLAQDGTLSARTGVLSLGETTGDITLGDGLSIENNVLSASASGGVKLYEHNILIRPILSGGFVECIASVITNSNIAFTLDTFKEWIITNNIKVPLTAQCRTKTNELGFDIANYLFKSGSMVYVQYNTIALNIDFENQTATLKSAGTNNNSFNTTIFTDTVREL